MSDDELEAYNNAYQANWSGYMEAKSKLETVEQKGYGDTMAEVWTPIIWGAMLGQPLKEFMSRFDWDKTDADGNQGIYTTPPCGDMPDAVMLVCYHAKRLEDIEKSNELPVDAIVQFNKRRRELLYGQDALSVIELFEVGL